MVANLAYGIAGVPPAVKNKDCRAFGALRAGRPRSQDARGPKDARGHSHAVLIF